MKIEIEFEEIEALKNTLTKQDRRIKELEDELKKLDTKSLKEQAVNLSMSLFDNYMECVFKNLGFQQNWSRNSVEFTDNLEHWLGEHWWNSKRLNITIGATITNQFKDAFLKMGIKPNSELEE